MIRRRRRKCRRGRHIIRRAGPGLSVQSSGIHTGSCQRCSQVSRPLHIDISRRRWGNAQRSWARQGSRFPHSFGNAFGSISETIGLHSGHRFVMCPHMKSESPNHEENLLEPGIPVSPMGPWENMEEPWKRNGGRGIVEKESWRRKIMEE